MTDRSDWLLALIFIVIFLGGFACLAGCAGLTHYLLSPITDVSTINT